MIPIDSPAMMTLRFFIAAAIIGTNGGEQMNATDDMTVVSESIFITLANINCNSSDPKITRLRYPNIAEPLLKSNLLKSAIEATTMLKT